MTTQIVTQNEIITIEHDGKKVNYDTKIKKWEYDCVSEDIVQKVNPALYTQITRALEKSVVEYQERVREESERIKREMVEKAEQELTAFKEKVAPLIPAEFETSYHKMDGFAEVRWLEIKKSGIDADIFYNDRVYRGSGWGGSKTDLVWVVEFAYKKQRYLTLEKAIAGAVKKINERVAGDKLKRAYEDEKNKERKNVADSLKTLGISFEVDNKWIRTGRGGGYSQELPTAKINLGKDKSIRGLVDRRNDKPIKIYQVSIQGAFTTEQFKELAEFIESLNLKGNYE